MVEYDGDSIKNHCRTSHTMITNIQP